MSDDDQPPEDNVIRVGFGKPPGVSFGKVNCWRHSPVVERLNRTVHCSVCGVELDAFEELLRVAESHDRYVYITKQTQERQRELASLDHEVRKAKARLRNANRKDAEAAVAEERAKEFERRRSIDWKVREINQLATQIGKLNAPGVTSLEAARRRKEER